MSASFAALQAIAEIAPSYTELRIKHPEIPARKIHAYLRSESGESFEVFMCPGHVWVEGEPDRCDEGPIRCSICGADGDA